MVKSKGKSHLVYISLVILFGLFVFIASAGGNTGHFSFAQSNQITASACKDTDGGQNPNVAGTCAGANGNYKDSCTTIVDSGGGPAVKEYYCNSDTCVARTMGCGNKTCTNGACV